MMGDARPVLVITQPDDVTADMVIGELNGRRVPVMRFDAADFPAAVTMSAHIGDGRGLGGSVTTASRRAELAGIRSVYYRRPNAFTFSGLDKQDERFAILQARYGFGGVLANLPGCLYVNHPHAIADCEYKPAQLAVAVQLGFTVPATLITNDPDEARTFAGRHGEVIYKPLRGSPYQQNGQPRTLLATPVKESDLDDQVAGTAHLFQARVNKTADLRVTVIGDRVFCVRIDSGLLDWRYDYGALTYTATDPPAGVARLMLTFLERFGLVFGCFDFAVREDGEAVFLECNPNGQWRWLEDHTGLPMTAALVDLLESGVTHD
jgi:ATP-grasp ribosomal peptide maturase